MGKVVTLSLAGKLLFVFTLTTIVCTLPFFFLAFFIALCRDYFCCNHVTEASWARKIMYKMAEFYDF